MSEPITNVTDHTTKTGHATRVFGMPDVGAEIMRRLGPKSLGRASQVSTAWHDAVDAYAKSRWRAREASVQALRDHGALLWDGTRMQKLSPDFSERVFAGPKELQTGKPAAQPGKWAQK